MNRSWNSGPLVMDGTFVHFPPRYGQVLWKNVELNKQGSFPKAVIFPDSQMTSSYFDYRWGDFLYDELEVGMSSISPGRLFSMIGFKRSYAGREGQYIQPSGFGPGQQSYRLDYASTTETSQVDISAARLITDSGFPDDSITGNGSYKDLITVAGIIWKKDSQRWKWKMHTSQFNQKLRLDRTGNKDVTKNIGRSFFHMQVADEENRFPLNIAGFVMNAQAIRDSLYRNLSWMSLFFGRSGVSWNAQVGFTLPGGFSDAQIFAQTEMNYDLRGWRWTSGFQIETVPVHYSGWQGNTGQDFETWYNLRTQLGRQFSKIYLSGGFTSGVRETPTAGFGDEYLTGTFNFNWTMFRNWDLHGDIRMSPNAGVLTDGVARRTVVGIRGQHRIFREKMIARIHLWSEGFHNRDRTLWFDPFNHRNEIITQIESTHKNYTVLNLKFEAEIAAVIIKYRVLNLLNALYPSLSGTFPDLSEESVLFQANPYLPSMGRLVNFSVTWHFQD